MALGTRGLLSLLAVLALPAPVRAATSLVELSAATKPTARRSSGIAIDPNGGSDLIYIFGGYGGSQRNDLWYYDTAQSKWVSVPAGSPPAARDRHALGFDRNLSKLVVFGGLKSGLPASLYADLYIYGPTWTALTAAGDKPTGRMDVAFHWMPHLNKFLMFGGATTINSFTGAVTAVTNELWTLEIQLPSTAVWTKLTPGGSVPSARGAPCTAYDEANHRLIVFGGMTNDTTSTGGTYVYDVDANGWYALSPAGTAPTGRGFCASAYDAGAQVLALYGGAEGATPRGDTFLFAPDLLAPYPPPTGAWSQENPTPSTPGVLSDAPAAYSATLGGTVFFGGYNGSAYQSGLWLLQVSGAGDATPPVEGTVNDGSGADLAFQPSTTTIEANWTAFTDAQSGVTGYRWAIGTSAGAQDVMAFTAMGITGLTATKSGLTLVSGTTYYVTVEATNGAGLTSTASSNGVKVDATPPLAGGVADGLALDADLQASSSVLECNWLGFDDPESGVSGYRWAVGTSPGAEDLLPFTSAGIVGDSASAAGLNLVMGLRYYVTVEARNGAGLVATATSDGVVVDATPPAAGTVSDGPGPDLDAQSSETLAANWTAFVDAEAGISGYRWAIGTSAGAQDVMPFTSAGISGQTATRSGLSLTSGTIYFVTVEATNGLGLTSTSTSDGVLVDRSGPTGGSVEDGGGPDVDWQTTSDTIRARWTGFADPETGIASYRWGIGTGAGLQDVVPLTTTGLVGTSASATGLSLSDGQTYFVTVEATNGVGLTWLVGSDGVTVDTSAPVAGTVWDGTGADLDLQPSRTSIAASWTGFTDPHSGIVGYEWAIGTAPGASDVRPFEPIGLATSASASGLNLAYSTPYFVTVRASNAAGLSTLAVSDGVQAELPAASLVVVGIRSPVRVGEPVDVVVEARDAGGAAVPGFADQVRFSSTDGAASIPPDYTFVPGDAGRHLFAGALVFQTTGVHTVTVTDVQAPLLVGQQAGIEVVAAGPPLVARAANPRAAVGVPYRYNGRGMVIATGDPVLSYASCGGPADFFVEPKSGAVRWTPLSAGTVNLCVRASNGLGSDSFAFDVQVEAAPAALPTAVLTATPDRGPMPLLVVLDGNASTAGPGAAPLLHEWLPGDGSSPGTGSPWRHTYARPAGYQARLRVYDALGGSAQAQAPIVVLASDGRTPPSVRIAASALEGEGALSVTLRAEGREGSSPIVRYLWELVPDASLEGATITRTFGPGRFLVKVTALDALGLAGTDEVEIAVRRSGREPPWCRAWADPPTGPAPHTVSFAAYALAATGEVAALDWDFGAQGQSTLATPVVRYESPGAYRARLKVVDAAGLECHSGVSVVVTGPSGQALPRIVEVPTGSGRCGLAYPVEGEGYRPLVFAETPVTWTLVNGPPGIAIDPRTGALSWRPELTAAPVTLTIAAENAAGRDERTFVLQTECASSLAFEIVGCGCSTEGEAGAGGTLLVGVALLLAGRRRARPSA